MMSLLILIFEFFKIGLFSIGGGHGGVGKRDTDARR